MRYTYSSGLVLDEKTGQPSPGIAGILREVSGGPVQVYDLNDSPIPNIQVGPRGVHQAFRADIPDGVIDFGSTPIPVVSQESHRAGLQAVIIAEQAVEASESARGEASDAAAAARLAASVVVATPRFVLHGDDADAPRPDEDVLPVIWVGSVPPSEADTERDHWIRPEPWAAPTE